MKFFGKTHIIIMWTIAFAFAVWMEIELIKLYFEAERQQQKTFPCTYISGTCTVKPTYTNCKVFGSTTDDDCERKLNYDDFRTDAE